jgi:hypothetical protein
MSDISATRASAGRAEYDSATPKQPENMIHVPLRNIRAKQDDGT